MRAGLAEEIFIILHAIWQRRWIVLGVAWAVCLGGWFYVSRMPDRYEAKARVFVQLRQILPSQTAGTMADAQKDIDRIRQTLTSRASLEKVVRGTDLVGSGASDSEIAARAAGLGSAITVVEQQDNLFEISANAASGKLAQQIVQKVIDVFIEDNMADRRNITNQSLTFYDQQLEQRKKALQDAKVKQTTLDAQYLGSLPGTGSLDDRINAARTQLGQVTSDLAAAQSALAAVNGQMASTAATVAGGTAAGPAQMRVETIRGQLAEARARGWTDSHPDVIALKSQLAAAEVAARNEPVSVSNNSNPLYMSYKSVQADKAAQVAALTQRKAQIESDLQRFNARQASQPGVAADQAQADREYQVLKDQYDKLLSDRAQMQLQSQAQDQTQAVKFDVVDPPTLPTRPGSPNRPLLLGAVLAAGVGVGMGVAFGLSKLSETFPSAGRLERATGMPVIGTIGEILSEDENLARRRQLRLFAGGAGALLCVFALVLGIGLLQRKLGA